jgi:GT2 family glycosyltransferase
MQDSDSLGVVVIGRNEGQRLKRCLESVCGVAKHVVYVDSGSRDDSVALGRALGVSVVELDRGIPFTAARARNEGFRVLLEQHPALDYAFFVDGDCEVAAGWLETAQGYLNQQPRAGLVWGRRRERHPEKSLYNMLCNMEWDSIPPGETKICGGDAVIRVRAFREVSGYRADLICGEEPELCVRLRARGWLIWRLDAPMTLHDASLYHFSQWWTRALRGGYAFAQGASLHGAPPERLWVAESRKIWLWGLGFPLAVLALALAAGWWALLLLLVYPLQVVRLALTGKRSARENWWQGVALVICKFPEMLGQSKFLLDRQRRVQSRLIEYK